MPSRQDGFVLADLTLLRADVADAAVAGVNIVTRHEFSRPGPCLVQAGEALGDELGPVLGGAAE